MWEKYKSNGNGTELTAKIELGGQKTLNATIKYIPRNRWGGKAPYGIALDFYIDEWEVRDSGFGPYTIRKMALDFGNMPKGCFLDGFTHEKRLIGPLNQLAKRYDTEEKVLEAFRNANPDYHYQSIEEIGAAV